MGRRTLLLIASILVAALGTALIWLYVQGADTRAVSSETDVPVYVATRTVNAGGSVDGTLAVVSHVPQSMVASFGGALVRNKSQLTGYAKSDILQGLPLLTTQISTTQTPPAPAVPLDPKKLAIQMSLPDPQRLAGLLQPGSRIRIYVATKSSGTATPQAQRLLDGIKVLASGPVAQPAATTGSAPNGQVPQANVVLEVTDDEARTLVAAQSEGSGGNSLWFGLLGSQLLNQALQNQAG